MQLLLPLMLVFEALGCITLLPLTAPECTCGNWGVAGARSGVAPQVSRHALSKMHFTVSVKIIAGWVPPREARLEQNGMSSPAARVNGFDVAPVCPCGNR